MNAGSAPNPYLPGPVTIDKITVENDAKDLRTFRLVFCNDEDGKSFGHECGQFAMLSVPGAGESPIGIASSPREETCSPIATSADRSRSPCRSTAWRT